MVQCEKMAGHELHRGDHNFRAKEHQATPRASSIMWHGTSRITWRKFWTPRPPDPAFVERCQRAARDYGRYAPERLVEMIPGLTLEEVQKQVEEMDVEDALERERWSMKGKIAL
jgi:hypothetical protein